MNQKKSKEEAKKPKENSESDSEDSSENKPTKKEETKKPKEEAKKPKEDSSESGSEESSENKDKMEETHKNKPEIHEQTNKKRKSDNQTNELAKKSKTETGPATIFVASLSYNSTEETLRYHFKECGQISEVRIAMRDGKPRGFAHIDFTTPEAATKALKLSETELDGRSIRIELTDSKQRNGGDTIKNNAQNNEGSSTVFVGNLSFNSTEDSLRSVFENHGEIQQIRIPTREDGSLKGFAYVQYNSPEEAKTAVSELNGADIDGRSVRLDLANESRGGGGDRGGPRGRSDRGPRGRGDRGFRGRGDRGFRGRGDRGRGRGGPRGFARPEGRKTTFDE